MTAINEEHREWAIVDRMKRMLDEPHPDYSVTQSYSLCLAILAWVMQRIRTPETPSNSVADKAAISLKRELERQRAENLPWAIRSDCARNAAQKESGFESFSAFDFLKWLRDAACHGDARQIEPVNEGRRLVGFQFCLKARDDRERTLVLSSQDLRRIGGSLATMYCEALRSVDPAGLSQLDEGVNAIIEVGSAA